MHALALLQHGIRDFRRALGRRVAPGREGPEIDDDGRRRRPRLALEADCAAAACQELAELVVDEYAADVVLRQQRLDDRGRQLLVLFGR